MERLKVLVLALLVLLAGCSGSVQETSTTTTTTIATTPSTSTSTTETPRSTTTTWTPTTTAAPANPWAAEEVTVAVDDSLNESRNISPLVNETLAYWNEHASVYGDYEITFTTTTDTSSADLVVKLVKQITDCGTESENTTVGCAPRLETGTHADDQETVRVVGGYTDETTQRILKHEFGHVLGIRHGEAPMPTMRSWTNTTYLKKPDAQNRTSPWENNTLSVYVDDRNWTVTEQRHAQDQVNHALDYFEQGADGHVPGNVSFVEAPNRSVANIVISWPDSLWCTPRGDIEDACWSAMGYDTDTDPALEQYTTAYIEIGRIEHDLIGWYVGQGLAFLLGLTNEEELPPPFVDPDYETASGEWWE